VNEESEEDSRTYDRSDSRNSSEIERREQEARRIEKQKRDAIPRRKRA